MDTLLRRLQRLFLLCCGLGLAALLGWGSLGYLAWSARNLKDQLADAISDRNEMRVQRDAALAKYEQLQRSTRDVTQLQANIAARAEDKPVLEPSRIKPEVSTAKEQMANLMKRIQQTNTSDLLQTGSIRKVGRTAR